MRGKSNILIFFICVSTLQLVSQGRLVLNNDPHIVISNGAYVVLDNNNPNAITQLGSGGRVISEGETNRLRWNISNAMGTYIVPFYDNDNVPVNNPLNEIPLVLTIGSGGTAGATNHIDFSTYDGITFDNVLYMPSAVTNMGSATAGVSNVSDKVIDRFWIIDANHATKPDVTLSFSYVENEWSSAGNTIAEANLGAQRWNSTALDWDGILYPPDGTVNAITNSVSSVDAPAADFFSAWTLVDITTPLPIELLSFDAKCDGNNVVIKWITATETNNNFFTLEKSIDGIYFSAIGSIAGAGNSTSNLNYSFTDYNSYIGICYYRLSQTDYNGEIKIFNMIIAENCNSSLISVNAFTSQVGTVEIVIEGSAAGTYTASLFDALGKKNSDKLFEIVNGSNRFSMDLSEISAGIYFLKIENGSSVFSKKIFVYR
jgi:hypothetical protein